MAARRGAVDAMVLVHSVGRAMATLSQTLEVLQRRNRAFPCRVPTSRSTTLDFSQIAAAQGCLLA